MPKIDQLPSGNFNAKVFDYTDSSGKRHYKSITAPSKREVKQLVAVFLAQREEKKSDIPNITVGQAIDKYIENNRNILSPSTIRLYVSTRRASLQGIMNIPISKINSMDLQKEVDLFAKNHSPKTVRERYGFVVRSITAFYPDARFKVNLPLRKKSEVEIPTQNEVIEYLEASKDTELEAPLCLLAICGMRPCEISALEVSDIDFENQTAYIHKDLVKGDDNVYRIKDNTKTPAGTRRIKLFTPAFEILKKYKDKKGYITSLNPDGIYKAFNKLCKKNNFKYYKPYLLRHYCVSVMLRMNIPKNYIAEYVGHESERMIDAVYGHIMQDQKADIFAGVEAFYDKMHNKMHNEK